MTETESTLDAVRERLSDFGAGRINSDACLKSIRVLVSEPDLIVQLESAFPKEMAEIGPEWKALIRKTWDNVLSRPRAWKILAAAAKSAGVDI